MKINTPRELGLAIQVRRGDLGLTQAVLAERAGVSRPWLSSVEAGKATAEFGRILRVLDALGLGLRVELREDQAPVFDLSEYLSEYDRREL